MQRSGVTRPSLLLLEGHATAQEHISNLLLHVLIHTVSCNMQAEKRSPPRQTNKTSMAVKSTSGLKYIFHDCNKPLWRRRKYLTREISLLFQPTNQSEIQFHNEKSKYRGLSTAHLASLLYPSCLGDNYLEIFFNLPPGCWRKGQGVASTLQSQNTCTSSLPSPLRFLIRYYFPLSFLASHIDHSVSQGWLRVPQAIYDALPSSQCPGQDHLDSEYSPRKKEDLELARPWNPTVRGHIWDCDITNNTKAWKERHRVN